MLDSLLLLLFITLLVIHVLLDHSIRGVRSAAPQNKQSYGIWAHGANKVGQGAIAGLFSSQMKYSLASLLSGEPKFEISGECGSG